MAANCIENLEVCCEICEPARLTMVLEPLNWYANHPGLFLRYVPQAYAICKAVDSPSCKILNDLYHQQVDIGNLIPNLEMAWDETDYLQVGDNPGRKEPTTGEINYKNIFKWLYERQCKMVIGMEHHCCLKDGSRMSHFLYGAPFKYFFFKSPVFGQTEEIQQFVKGDAAVTAVPVHAFAFELRELFFQRGIYAGDGDGRIYGHCITHFPVFLHVKIRSFRRNINQGRTGAPVPSRGIVPRMQGIAVQVLAELRVAEGWSVANIAGGILLAVLVVGALAAALLVGRKR